MGELMAAGAKVGIKVMSIVIGIPVGIVTKKAVERLWVTVRPEDPPRKPTESDVRWGDAIAWGALSATGIVIADLLTRRSAEAAFRAITGNQPPAAKAAKGAKKLEKASEKANATAD
jgi:Protein of unknown function (DUF4235)